jgi:endonuclease G, mitochondrial
VNDLVGLARRLLRRGGSQESAGGETPLTDDELSVALQERLTADALAVPKLEAAEAANLARELVANVSSVLRKVSEGAAASDLSEAETSSLEAIVMLSGRPALRYSNGKLEPLSKLKSNEEWRLLVSVDHKVIEELSRSVGRITRLRPGAAALTIGTGWRRGDNLVVTNRHVAAELADNAGAPANTWKIDSRHTTVIDFAAVDNAAAQAAFIVTSIAWCADRDGPDLAILAFNTQLGIKPPAALPLAWNGDLLGRLIERNGEQIFQGRKVYVVGHPWYPGQSSAVTKVFGKADGMKRWSPGYVTAVRSATPTFRHDCSTLGGNSGSCVLSAETHEVVGVHFSGVNTDDTGKGSANAALSLASLKGLPVGKILAQGRV